jgi:hypothetical protein
VLHVAHPPGLEAERAYALDVVLGVLLGIEHSAAVEPRDDVSITLRGDVEERRVRLPDVLFALPREDWLTTAVLPVRPLARADPRAGGLEVAGAGPALPVLFGDGAPAATVDGGEVRLGVDVFGSAFFMLTRLEEAVRPERDDHSRFPAEASLAVAEDFLERPIVHEYAELLWAALRACWPRLERPRRAWRRLPSHDVDQPFSPRASALGVGRSLAGDLVKRRDPRLAGDRLRWEARRGLGRAGPDPYDTFDLLMDASERAGTRSAFYFMAGVTDPRHDGSYSLRDPRIAALLRRIHARGHEIGLHPSYASHHSSEVVASELATLREACAAVGVEQETWGGRQHFLRWENPTTWQAWEEAGLDYDSTLGFAARAGFRTGACVEYPAFNVRTGRRLALRERPLVAMEVSLFEYARLTHAEAEDLLSRLRDRCRAVGGDFTLLWHNSSLLSRRDRALYARLMTSAP